MWIQLAILVVSMVASAMLAKPAKIESPVPGEVEATTAEEGGNIPVLFGTRDIKNQNVCWYGDIRIIPIKKSSGGKK